MRSTATVYRVSDLTWFIDGNKAGAALSYGARRYDSAIIAAATCPFLRFNARRRGICYGNSARPSVRLSVRPSFCQSVTLPSHL